MGTAWFDLSDSQGNTTAVSGSFTVNVSTLPLVQPLQAQKVYQNWGACTHPNFGNEVYQFSAEVVERVASINGSKCRGMYPSVASLRDATIAACRAQGVKWLAELCTESDTQALINNKVDHAAANAADVLWGFEGPNEPNPSSTSDSWVAPTAQRVRWIAERVRSKPSLAGARLLGPAMHDKNLDGVNGLHWQQWVAYKFPDGKSVLDFMDTCAIHCYPGDVPLTRWAERSGWVDAAFGPGYPRVITETGYSNALGTPRVGGHAVFSEQASAIYDFQQLLEFAKIGVPTMRYELLNDPDSTNGSTEANFGLWRVGSTVGADPDIAWVEKPTVAPMRAALGWCKADNGAAVAPVGLSVTAPTDVHWAVIGRGDGLVRIYLWRYGRVWNPDTEQPVALGSVAVTVTDNAGARTVSVGPAVTYLDVRRA